MNKNGVFLSFHSLTHPNRQVEFKFGGPETELHARDCISTAHRLPRKGHRKPRR